MHNEVENIAKLNHKHILKIVDSNTQKYEIIEEHLYYVAEYINGETLEKYCSNTI
jgi:serine/threonine protein kinase